MGLADSMIRILIGIPVLDNLPMTRAYLQSFFRYTDTGQQLVDITLLLIDNGSKEDIPRMLRDEFSNRPFPIYYRRNPQNLGVAVAWNQILAFWPDAVPGAGFKYDYYVIIE